MDGITGGDSEGSRMATPEELESLNPFQVNDRVIFLGAEGTVINTASDYWHRFITIKFDSGREMLFEKDGSYCPEWNVKLEKTGEKAPPPKVKKWKYAYEKRGLMFTTPLMSQDAAITFFNTDFIGSYTVLPWTETEVSRCQLISKATS